MPQVLKAMDWLSGDTVCAHEILGLDTIRCFIRDLNDDEAENVEVEENLFWGDLTKVERIKSVGLWVRSYRAANPDIQHGGDRGNQHTGGKFQSLELARAGEVLAKKQAAPRAAPMMVWWRLKNWGLRFLTCFPAARSQIMPGN